MRVDAFDFDLPKSAIALRPVRPRDAARLLVVRPDSPSFEDRIVRDLPDLLRPGDALVVNDTKVLPARLIGTRRRGDASLRMEALLISREAPNTWRALLRPARRIGVGESITFDGPDDRSFPLLAEVMDRKGAEAILRFMYSGSDLDEMLEEVGRPPLPPYIESRRAADAADVADYQTIFAAQPGAVAAPTAGLHFTPGLLQALADRGIKLHRVTLHVGPGTFLPVKSETTEDHVMHAETGLLGADVAAALNAVRARGGRCVAVGTTSLRILESAVGPDGLIQPFAGETSIFITPGYRFGAVDGLMTNFHLPRSTLFMLVSAFTSLATMQAAYAHAIASGYRFYSYGDASLLWRGEASA